MVKLHLSKNQINKVRRGGSIQLSKESINNSSGYDIPNLHPENIRKLKLAMKKGSGARIYLTHPELEGSGLFDIIKKGLSFLAKPEVAGPLLDAVQQIATPFVGKDIAQVGREVVRGITGRGSKKMMSTTGQVIPMHFPTMPSEEEMTGGRIKMKKSTGRPKKNKVIRTARGITPAGYRLH